MNFEKMHEFRKNHGRKSWDIDFQKCLDCDIFLKNLKMFKFWKLCFFFCFFLDIVDFVDFLKSSEKELTFIFLIQSILFSG